MNTTASQSNSTPALLSEERERLGKHAGEGEVIQAAKNAASVRLVFRSLIELLEEAAENCK